MAVAGGDIDAVRVGGREGRRGDVQIRHRDACDACARVPCARRLRRRRYRRPDKTRLPRKVFFKRELRVAARPRISKSSGEVR